MHFFGFPSRVSLMVVMVGLLFSLPLFWLVTQSDSKNAYQSLSNQMLMTLVNARKSVLSANWEAPSAPDSPSAKGINKSKNIEPLEESDTFSLPDFSDVMNQLRMHEAIDEGWLLMRRETGELVYLADTHNRYSEDELVGPVTFLTAHPSISNAWEGGVSSPHMIKTRMGGAIQVAMGLEHHFKQSEQSVLMVLFVRKSTKAVEAAIELRHLNMLGMIAGSIGLLALMFGWRTWNLLKPLKAIAQGMQKSGAGSFKPLPRIPSQHILKSLHADFTEMQQRLMHRYKDYQHAQHQLEGKLREKTKAMDAVLTHIEEGVVFLSPKNMTEPPFSNAVMSIFPHFQTGMSFHELIADQADPTENQVHFPEQFTDQNGQLFRVRYQSLRSLSTEMGEKSLVIFSNLSSQRQHQSQLEALQRAQSITTRILAHWQSYWIWHFTTLNQLKQSSHWLNNPRDAASVWQQELLDTLHYLARWSATFGQMQMATLAYESTYLVQQTEKISPSNLEMIRKNVTQLEDSLRKVPELFYLNPHMKDWLFPHGTSTQNRRINTATLLKMASTRLGLPEMPDEADYIDTHVLFGKYHILVNVLAEQLGKKAMFEIEGSVYRLPLKMVENLDIVLTNLVANAVGHGIETPELRVLEKKVPQGKVIFSTHLDTQTHPNQLRIECRDDGAGIDARNVRRKIEQLGGVNLNQSHAISEESLLDQLVYAQSTGASGLEHQSGLKTACWHLDLIGGKMRFDINKDQGVSAIINIPVPQKASSHNPQ